MCVCVCVCMYVFVCILASVHSKSTDGRRLRWLVCVCVLGSGSWGPGGHRKGVVSQGYGGAGVLEAAGQHATVQLVEVHQVDKVCELGGTVVQAEEHLALLFILEREG